MLDRARMVPGGVSSRRRACRSHIGCPRSSCGSHLACAGRASPDGREWFERGLRSSKQRCPPRCPVVELEARSAVMDTARDVVVIGVNPHKRSVTIEARDAREVLRATGSFPTTTAGYRAMLRYCRQEATLIRSSSAARYMGLRTHRYGPTATTRRGASQGPGVPRPTVANTHKAPQVPSGTNEDDRDRRPHDGCRRPAAAREDPPRPVDCPGAWHDDGEDQVAYQQTHQQKHPPPKAASIASGRPASLSQQAIRMSRRPGRVLHSCSGRPSTMDLVSMLVSSYRSLA